MRIHTKKLEDIDLLVNESHLTKADRICLATGYIAYTLPEDCGDCVHYIKNNTTIHIHKRIELLAEKESNDRA